MKRLMVNGIVLFTGVMALPYPLSLHQFKSPLNAQPANHSSDPRLESLQRFFRLSGCPAVRLAHVFLQASDRYDLDWRLLPSISFVESSGGKVAPNNNLFGWDAGRAAFATMQDGIYTVAARLAQSALYRDKNLDELLYTYNPNADYARKVKSVMRRIAPSEQLE